MRLMRLTRYPGPLFAAVGGWRTVAEGVASQVLFAVAYPLTGRLITAALAAVAGVVILGLIRMCSDRKYWSAVIGVGVVAISALLAGGTGRPAAFYLQGVVVDLVGGVVCLASMLVRWPLVGLAVGGVRRGRLRWRQDPARRRLYQRCTAVFLAKFAISTAVLVPLYAAGSVIPLGIASTLLLSPAASLCIYLTWRILRGRQATPQPESAG